MDHNLWDSKIALPTALELVLSVGTMLTSPTGIPAWCASLARASAEIGVNDGGLITTVQPTAIAGATLRAIIAAGKFHGGIIPATPIGCLILTMRLFQDFSLDQLMNFWRVCWWQLLLIWTSWFFWFSKMKIVEGFFDLFEKIVDGVSDYFFRLSRRQNLRLFAIFYWTPVTSCRPLNPISNFVLTRKV